MMTNTAQDNMVYLKTVRTRMEEAGFESSRAESEQLIRHFSKMSRVDFFSGKRMVSDLEKAEIEAALQRRLSGVPLQYIFNEAGFFGYRFFVNENTLIPRPETELLAEAALQYLDKSHPGSPRGISFNGDVSRPKILDLGTGTGVLAVTLTIQRPDSRMTALDISEAALLVARKNIEFHGLAGRIRLLTSDLFGTLRGAGQDSIFDLIVSNPPYIPENELEVLPQEVRREPRVALNGGREGLDLIGQILQEAPEFLSSGGGLMMEIGLGQSGPIEKLIEQIGEYRSWQFIEDFNGIHRIVSAIKK